MIDNILAHLHTLGIRARLDGPEVVLNGPVAALTDELLDELRAHREQLVEEITARDAPRPSNACRDCGARAGSGIRCSDCAARRVTRPDNTVAAPRCPECRGVTWSRGMPCLICEAASIAATA